MSITNNNAVAKVAAAVAGAGLVLSSFAFVAPAQADTTTDLQNQINALLAQIASLQGQLGGSTTTAGAQFTRDLTIGSTGADVTELQTWLISKGYSIPAGATGYFGTQTQAAVAAYQAANGITPAAGYFGPITRAKVNASLTVTTGGTGTGGSTGGTLSGGEADLTNYDLRAGDDLSEGDTNVEIANAQFDVKGGDVNVQRVRLTLQANDVSSDVSTDPWRFFDRLYVYDGNTKVGSVDAGTRDAWDQNDTDTDLNSSGADSYTIDISTNDIVKEGDTADLSIRADAQDTIDTTDQDQSFTIGIKNQDIRAVDAAGIQQYEGSDTDTVDVAFNGADNADLSVREDSDDPDAGTLVADENQSTDNLTVFKFDLKNDNDSDAILDRLNIQVATSSGDATNTLSDLVRRATLTVGGKDYDADIHDNTSGTYAGYLSFNDFNSDDVMLNGNDSTEFTLTIDLASQSGHYNATGNSLQFVVRGSDVTAEDNQTGDNITVSGTATSNIQTIVVNGGITAAGGDNSTDLTYNSNFPDQSYGTFTLATDVTAVGDDVYVPKGVAFNNASNTYAGFVIDPNMDATTTGATTTVSMTSTADVDNSNFYVVHDGDTETFTVTVTINPSTTGDFEVGIDKIRFSTTDADYSNLTTLEVDQQDSQFHTDPLHIPS